MRIILRFAVSYWACGELLILRNPIFQLTKNAARRARTPRHKRRRRRRKMILTDKSPLAKLTTH